VDGKGNEIKYASAVRDDLADLDNVLGDSFDGSFKDSGKGDNVEGNKGDTRMASSEVSDRDSNLVAYPNQVAFPEAFHRNTLETLLDSTAWGAASDAQM
jgi:hypothetical protein